MLSWEGVPESQLSPNISGENPEPFLQAVVVLSCFGHSAHFMSGPVTVLLPLGCDQIM